MDIAQIHMNDENGASINDTHDAHSWCTENDSNENKDDLLLNTLWQTQLESQSQSESESSCKLIFSLKDECCNVSNESAHINKNPKWE